MSNKFGAFGLEVLDLREEDSVRSIMSERYRFHKHLSSSRLSGRSIASIKPSDIAAFARDLVRKKADDHRGDRLISRSTCIKVMQLTSSIFDAAVAEGLRDDNPCLSVKIRKQETETTETATALTAKEVADIENTGMPPLPFVGKTLMLVAIGTGIRQGEQWNLEWKDVRLYGDDISITIRYGSQGLSPKNGKIRKVPLFGPALRAMRSWEEFCRGCVEDSPFYKSHRVFPSRNGGVRPAGAPEGFERWLKACGITRHVRWHDLRHTCGTALIQGYWGPKWDLVDIRDMLGHSSVRMAEMYSRHAEDTRLSMAAAKMRET